MAQASAEGAGSVDAPRLGQKVTLADYRNIALLLAMFAGLLAYLGKLAGEPKPDPSLVIGPVLAMGVVIAIAWVLMVLFRNLATVRGETPSAYYITLSGPAPADWIERPARVFNNLMQLPMLFYVVCVLMLVTGHLDRAELAYAWLFVVLRALHAIVYMAWNVVAYRFATWVMGSVTLFIIWVRFAIHAWPGF